MKLTAFGATGGVGRELITHALDAGHDAVRGADAVISSLGPSLDRKATGLPLLGGTHAILDAMAAEGVER